MDSNTTRSTEVIEDFRKRKLSRSAWYEIHRLIESFDDDRQSDIHWAKIGLITLIVLLISASIFFFGMTEIKIA